jgi:hypothetical protein
MEEEEEPEAGAKEGSMEPAEAPDAGEAEGKKKKKKGKQRKADGQKEVRSGSEEWWIPGARAHSASLQQVPTDMDPEFEFGDEEDWVSEGSGGRHTTR